MADRETERRVQLHLQRDLLATDLLTSLFWSAMSSFRHDTILRPFPSMFLSDDGHKDIRGMRRALNSLPPLDQLLGGSSQAVNNRSMELLQWVLNTKSFTVEYRPPSTFDDIASQTGNSPHSVTPQFIFELSYTAEIEGHFQRLSKPHGLFYAYHGSAVENFYSIIHNGLLSHFNKTAAFGEGTYLSTDLGVCLNWSPNGSLWPCSVLPHTASCVAVCEVIKHPSVTSRVQTGGEPNIQGKVPEQYFIVPNDELVRVKYLLVFGRQRTRAPTSWVMKHKFMLVLVLYLVFLLVLGVINSRDFRQFYSKYAPKWPWK